MNLADYYVAEGDSANTIALFHDCCGKQVGEPRSNCLGVPDVILFMAEHDKKCRGRKPMGGFR